jgi:aminoglycoside phosphotransferase family enzyme
MIRRFHPECYSLEEKLRFLMTPASYAERTRRVAVIETHFAWVFLTDRHAYKMKKPVRERPLDYRTLASRKRGCRREVDLNRRLAPRVYLEIVPLGVDAAGALELGRRRSIVDWLVKMRRLPAEAMLDHAIARGTARAADLRRVARLLQRFHACADRVPMTARAYIARFRRRMLANERVLLDRSIGIDRALVQRVARAQGVLLRRLTPLLHDRAAHVVDAHGDLRPEHVYLGRPAAVIDCLEFDRDLRALDPLEEMAFLALECRRLGGARAARELLAAYARAGGERLAQPLEGFYTSQRAATRAKNAAWHVRDPRITNPDHWRARAESYLDDALAAARRGGDGSGLGRRRPGLEKRRKGLVREHSPQRGSEQRGDRQDREFVRA